ncbi:hypothetical protein [Haloarchaeobius litoreus]|uniref:Uncharacterized protein n=1 Tax=Haloarchaeobius litoreus TaxID=755306 RepID=A0ABD6DH16_9EURY|nr:hypothetical protein [Haloarchaeobius litoreus]
MSTLDDFATASEDTVDDENEECDCDALPDGVPCFECFLAGEATFDRGGA